MARHPKTKAAVTAESLKMPKTIGECADLLYKTKEWRLSAAKVVEELEAQETRIKEHIISELPKSKASGVAGKLARVTVQNKEVQQVEDWNAFYKYVAKNNAFDLLQRRIASKAVEERLENGEKLPGVKKFNVPTVSINKL